MLPPTVVGIFLLKLLGPNGPMGSLILDLWGKKLVMTWQAAIFTVVIVTFPLMYRTVRGSFESFDHNLLYAGKTLGRSNAWVFWRVLLPGCRQGLLAGTVLSFPRGLGEYGATSMVSGSPHSTLYNLPLLFFAGTPKLCNLRKKLLNYWCRRRSIGFTGSWKRFHETFPTGYPRLETGGK